MENLTASEMLDNLEYKLDELQKDMDEVFRLIDEMKSDSKQKVIKKKKEKRFPNHKSKVVFLDDRSIWKNGIYKQIDSLVGIDMRFNKRSEVLHYLYRYMNINYSIVWEQEVKEYWESGYKPRTIDIVYENSMYRSIFEAVLYDMISDAKKIKLSVVEPDVIEM